MTLSQRNPLITRCLRAIRLFAHIATGSAVAVFRFPKISNAEQAQLLQNWSIKLMHILAFHLVIHGKKPDELQPKNLLLVCNHISWLDIFAISTNVLPCFIAKKELESWPVFGRVIKNAGTLFINRNNKRDTSKTNQQMEQKLKQGACMAIFPESTTSDGQSLLPFKSSLFKSALMAGSTVQPLAIRYFDKFGHFSDLPAYCGKTSFFVSVWRILSMPSGIIEMSFCEPIELRDADEKMHRTSVANQAYNKINERFGVEKIE